MKRPNRAKLPLFENLINEEYSGMDEQLHLYFSKDKFDLIDKQFKALDTVFSKANIRVNIQCNMSIFLARISFNTTSDRIKVRYDTKKIKIYHAGTVEDTLVETVDISEIYRAVIDVYKKYIDPNCTIDFPMFEGYVRVNETFNALWDSGSQGGLNCNSTDGQSEITSKLLNYIGSSDNFESKLSSIISDSSLVDKLIKKVGTRAQDLSSDIRKSVMKAIINASSDQDKLYLAAFMITQYTDSYGAAFTQYLDVVDYSSEQRLREMIDFNVNEVKRQGKVYFIDTKYVHKCGFNKWFNDGDPTLEDIKNALECVNSARVEFGNTNNMKEVLDFLSSYIALNNGSDSLSDSVLSFFKDQVKKYNNAPKVV